MQGTRVGTKPLPPQFDRSPFRVIFDRGGRFRLPAHVRFTPKATKLLRRREMTQRATSEQNKVRPCGIKVVPLFRQPRGAERLAQSGSEDRLTVHAGQKTAVPEHGLQFQDACGCSSGFFEPLEPRERRRKGDVGDAEPRTALDRFASVGSGLLVLAAAEF